MFPFFSLLAFALRLFYSFTTLLRPLTFFPLPLAIKTAKVNVPDAEHLLSDCWTALPLPTNTGNTGNTGNSGNSGNSGTGGRGGCGDGMHCFDWIVSNPPVHIHETSNFWAVITLVNGAWGRLVEGGTLWIVAQEQVNRFIECAYYPVVFIVEGEAC